MFPTHVGRLAIFDDYLFCGDVGSGSFGKARIGFLFSKPFFRTSVIAWEWLVGNDRLLPWVSAQHPLGNMAILRSY